MGHKVQFKEKRRLDNSSTLCCWCYKITLEPNPQYPVEANTEVGLDFNGETDIKDPANYAECGDYKRTKPTLGHSAGKWIVYKKPGAGNRELELCFIAPCAENAKTSVSLEYRSGENQAWNKLPFDGEDTILGPAIARIPSTDDVVALLARYEGLKLPYVFCKSAGPGQVPIDDAAQAEIGSARLGFRGEE